MSVQIETNYTANFPNYERLCKNLVEAIQFFLKEENIPYLSVYYRIKELSSINEKIERKGYANPLEELEDVCGVRIICYYSSDIVRIGDILLRELTVISQQDKSETLGEKEFGYRSNHFVAKIKKEWTSTPNYRKLEDFKVEVQIRTVLMHAWAEIEHKLNYKNEQQVPELFKRKLYRLSAKFEEADEQFEDLKNAITKYISTVSQVIEMDKSDEVPLEFDLETLKSFINIKRRDVPLPDADNRIAYYFDIFLKNNIGFKELSLAIEFAFENRRAIIEAVTANGYLEPNEVDFGLLLFFSLDVLNEEFMKNRFAGRGLMSPKWHEAIMNFKQFTA